MICPRGHPFDFPLGGTRCPICGVELEHEQNERKRFWITREDFRVIREGMRAAEVLAKAAVGQWPEAVHAQRIIADGQARLNRVGARTVYRRAKRK